MLIMSTSPKQELCDALALTDILTRARMGCSLDNDVHHRANRELALFADKRRAVWTLILSKSPGFPDFYLPSP